MMLTKSMAKRSNKKHRRRANRRARSPLAALAAAAIGLQTIGAFPEAAAAQSPPDQSTIRLQFDRYNDYQRTADRMLDYGPSFYFETPLGEKSSAEGSLGFDSISGASPLYLSSLSGASAVGIDDFRRSGDLNITHYFENFSLGIGGAASHEEDYSSVGGSLAGQIWSRDKNTVFSASVGANADDISASNDPSIDEHRHGLSYLLGVSQILSRRSSAQLNLTYSNGDGYFSDPYKPFDNRPHSRDQFALLARHVLFFPDLNASLHTDYRFAWDSWELQSHLFELAWYQPLGEIWTLRPNVRYYSQSDASFFHSVFPPEEPGSFYTADQRLSGFGGITAGLKIIWTIGDGYSADVSYSFLVQRADYALGTGSSGIEPFYAQFWSFGLTKKF